MLSIRITRVRPSCDDIPLPSYATEHSAGMDLYAAVDDQVVIDPQAVRLIPTAFAVEIPPGYEAQVRPRSGLALKHGVTVLNSPGTIDADYRGEIGVILMNHGAVPFTVRRGDRIAQLVVASCEHVAWEQVEDLGQTVRGAGGFGSSGVSITPPSTVGGAKHE